MEGWRLQSETVLNVILRVPAFFLSDILLRNNFINSFLHNYGNFSHQLGSPAPKDRIGTYFALAFINFVYYAGLCLSAALLLLPVKRLIPIYVFLLTGGLALLCDLVSEAYTRLNPEKPWISISREVFYMLVQGVLSSTAVYLTRPKPHGVATYTYLVPVLGRAYSSTGLVRTLHSLASKFALVMMLLYLLEHILPALRTLWVEIKVLHLRCQIIGTLYVFFSLCTKHRVLPGLLVFWMVLLLHHMGALVVAGKLADMQSHGFLLSLMICTAECCRSAVSIAGMSAAVSYLSMGVLKGTKRFLQPEGQQMGSVALDGWVEGVTMCLLAVQTGLTSLKTAHKAVVLSIVLFVVLTSLIQSLYELCDPILLNLCASQNKNVAKHIKALVVFTILWILPIIMTNYVIRFFQVDFWLLVIVSSALLTTVQVLGSLLVYAFFMYDMLSSHPVESLDDIVYYIKASVRVLEFLVALGVVLHGIYGSIFGEWSWFNSSVIIIHGYFNVWKRLQSGWRTFLLRRQATQKLDALAKASASQLQDLEDDVCAICYQEFQSARITECGHFFHAGCLRKWLYVQDFCPMCHAKI